MEITWNYQEYKHLLKISFKLVSINRCLETKKTKIILPLLLRMNELALYRFVFNTLDVNGDNVVRLAEMEKVNVEKWKEICRNTESLHGPTRYAANFV